MAKLLLIGGHADGDATDIPDEHLAQGTRDLRWTVAKTMPVSSCSVSPYPDPLVPNPPRHSVYRVCELHIVDTDRHGQRAVTKLRFGYEADMQPSEALVMLMQFYQNKPEQS